MLFSPNYSPLSLREMGWHIQAPNDETGVPAPERLRLRDAPDGGPERALRAELRATDLNPIGNTSRAEVYSLHASPSTLPADQWVLKPNGTYKFALSYFLEDPWVTATDSTWLTLTQLKGLKGGSPPIAIEAYKTRLRLKVTGKDWDLGPLPIGTWTTLELTVRLSVDGSNTDNSGWVQISRNGVEIVPRTLRRTMDTWIKDGITRPDPVYLKQGVYRSAAWKVTHVAYFGAPTVEEVI